ncbi:uncharacterized protein LOC115924753 [Strongylocentrotus purpuratus]|uniref:Uncharacterized protein n=1 Tax=Strongylocentrotus purpuratus TaxID=7668 RepID=A0A7M7P0N2_STRPU|nr:uncharacterized protein LOC115924753 [Strongylocentrotus purpuratus]
MPTDGSTSDISHQGTASASDEPTSHVLDNTFSTTGTLHTSLGTLSSVATSVATSFESITTETVKEEASSDSYHTGRSVATSQYDTSTGTDYFRETSNNLGTFVTLHQSIGTTGLVNTYSPKPFLASSDPTFETSTTIGQISPEVPTEDATTLEIDRPTLGITEGATTTPAEETKWSTTVKRATTDQRVTTQGPVSAETTSSWWVIFLGSVGAASLFLLLASCTGFIFAMVFKERRKMHHKGFESSDSSAPGSLEFNVTYNPGATTITDPEDPAMFHY